MGTERISSASLPALLAFAACLALGPSPAAAEGIGVVLLHAGSSWPGEFDRLRPQLEEAGYAVETPETCWAVHRLYGGTVDACLIDIDAAIAGLRQEGNDTIFLAGHDLGALNALYYADSHPELAGVVVWGPRRGGRGGSNVDVETATRLMNAGAGDKRADFSNGYVYSTPRALLSFRGPDSPLADEAELLTSLPVPLLWIDSNDSIGPRDPTPRFNMAPANALNTFIRSATDHFNMVYRSADDVVAWVGRVQAASRQQPTKRGAPAGALRSRDGDERFQLGGASIERGGCRATACAIDPTDQAVDQIGTPRFLVL